MPIFNLTDITFNKATGNKATGPLASLDGSNDKYNLNTYKYPIDLGSTDKAHYMIININEQGQTQFPGQLSGDKPTVVQNFLNTRVSAQGVQLVNGPAAQAFANGLGQLVATGSDGINAFTAELGSTFGASSGVGQIGSFLGGAATNGFSIGANLVKNVVGKPNFTRTIRRITDTIALYMPDTLPFTYTQNYDTPQIGGGVFATLAAGGSSLLDAINKNKGNPKAMGASVMQNLSPFIANAIAQSTGGVGKVLFAAATGVVQNPMLEVLYSSPAFRSFQFDFMFYPRDEKEATEVQNIIDILRFHQAPEVLSAGNGFFLIPPSEFDIKFMYNQKENPNIPKISTCVLESIFTDYAPSGFSAYEVPSQPAARGGTGMPVAIRLTLQFRETEIMTKASYDPTRQRNNYIPNDNPAMDNRDVGNPN
jgi:hypothetical protein